MEMPRLSQGLLQPCYNLTKVVTRVATTLLQPYQGCHKAGHKVLTRLSIVTTLPQTCHKVVTVSTTKLFQASYKVVISILGELYCLFCEVQKA